MKQIILPVLLVSAIILSCTTEDFVFNTGDQQYRNTVYQFDDTVVLLDSTEVIGKDVSAGQGPYLILGESEYAKCSLMIRFIGLTHSDTVESAWITLQPKSVIGDSGMTFTGTVHEIDTLWNEENIPEIKYGPSISTFTINGSAGVPDTIPLPIDLVETWIEVADTLNQGVILIPDNASFAKQYYARQNETVNSLNISFVEGDTVDVREYSSIEDTYITEIKAEHEPGLFMTNYLPHETILQFNLDAIPDNSTINRAEVVMYLDMDASFLGDEEYQIGSSQITSESWHVDDLTISTERTGLGTIEENGELRIPLTSLTQAWVAKEIDTITNKLKHPNYGILLSSLFSKSDLSSFVFRTGEYGPKLYVSYTEFKPVK